MVKGRPISFSTRVLHGIWAKVTSIIWGGYYVFHSTGVSICQHINTTKTTTICTDYTCRKQATFTNSTGSVPYWCNRWPVTDHTPPWCVRLQYRTTLWSYVTAWALLYKLIWLINIFAFHLNCKQSILKI